MVGSIKCQESFNWCFCILDIAAPRTPFSLSFSWIYGKLLFRDLFMYFTISHDSLSTFFWHAWFPYWYDIVSLQFFLYASRENWMHFQLWNPIPVDWYLNRYWHYSVLKLDQTMRIGRVWIVLRSALRSMTLVTSSCLAACACCYYEACAWPLASRFIDGSWLWYVYSLLQQGSSFHRPSYSSEHGDM